MRVASVLPSAALIAVLAGPVSSVVPAAAIASPELVAAARANDGASVRSMIAEGADANAADATGTTALHWAVYHDDAELVQLLIGGGADVSATNAFGATPLAEAAVTGNVDVIERLLNAGADVESPNAEGQTALMVVARTENTRAAALLIERGADVNAREQWKQQSALMWAAARKRPQMIRLLIEHGADVDARSKVYDWQRQTTVFPRAKFLPSGGLTPLLFAAREGCAACVTALLDAGADIDLPDPDEVTPLLLALLNARFDTARRLIEAGANLNKWDRWGRTPLYAAVDFNTLPTGGRPDRPSTDATTAIEIVDMLLAAGAYPNPQLKLTPPYRNVLDDRGADPILGIGATPLIRAARAGDTAAVERLLNHGALVDLPQSDGITALMAAAGLAAYSIDTRGRYVNEAQALETARALLGAGADIHATESFGQTALHGAAFRGWNEMVALLVEHGADVHTPDHDGYTPLDAALGRIRGRGREAAVVNVHEDTAAVIEAFARD